MSSLFGLITAFGLSTAAGLNAYIPLLLVAVLGKLEVLRLSEPYDVLASWPAIVILSVLLLIEFTVDKIPGVDHVNDVVQTVVRPAAGAVLFAANAGVITGMDSTLALAVGLLAALGTHGAKAAARPLVNVGTAGIGAPVVSIVEDVVAAIGAVLAVFFPVLFVLFAIAMVFVVIQLIRLARRVRNKLVSQGDS
jgi:hypothetical protein